MFYDGVTVRGGNHQGGDDDETANYLYANGDGGNGGLVFSFNGGEDGDVTSFGDLAPGDYTVVATDVVGCMAETTFTVADVDAVEVTASASAVSCNGDLDGSVELSAAGGTSLFEYSADGTDFGSVSAWMTCGSVTTRCCW